VRARPSVRILLGIALILSLGCKRNQTERFPNRVVSIVHVGEAPWVPVISPDGEYVYVGNRESNTVSVISTSRDSTVATVQGYDGPQGAAVLHNGQYVYFAHRPARCVSVLRTSDNQMIDSISFPDEVAFAVASLDDNRVYVSNWQSGNVSVLSTVYNSVEAVIPIG